MVRRPGRARSRQRRRRGRLPVATDPGCGGRPSDHSKARSPRPCVRSARGVRGTGFDDDLRRDRTRSATAPPASFVMDEAAEPHPGRGEPGIGELIAARGWASRRRPRWRRSWRAEITLEQDGIGAASSAVSRGATGSGPGSKTPDSRRTPPPLRATPNSSRRRIPAEFPRGPGGRGPSQPAPASSYAACAAETFPLSKCPARGTSGRTPSSLRIRNVVAVAADSTGIPTAS